MRKNVNSSRKVEFNEKKEKYDFSSDSKYEKFRQKINRQPYKIIYKGLLFKKTRKAIDKYLDFCQQEYVEKCWDKIIENYEKYENNKNNENNENHFWDGTNEDNIDNKDNKDNVEKLSEFSFIPKQNFENEQIIWQFWGTGWDEEKLPDIVKLCFKSVEKYKGNYKVIRIDENNMNRYIDFPEFILEKLKNGQMGYAHFTDILRLALLDLYGGVWLDATILLTDFLDEKYKKDEYFMFQRSENTEDKKKWTKLNDEYFSWDKRNKVKALNSVIFSRKKSKVIHTCLNLMLLFWKTYNDIPHYFFFQILYNRLMEKYLKNYRCEIVDDTFPHMLFNKWNDDFDENEYRKITQKVNIHKLTHKSVNNKECKKDSFYEYFLKMYGSKDEKRNKQ